jgi:hypothetical protein
MRILFLLNILLHKLTALITNTTKAYKKSNALEILGERKNN